MKTLNFEPMNLKCHQDILVETHNFLTWKKGLDQGQLCESQTSNVSHRPVKFMAVEEDGEKQNKEVHKARINVGPRQTLSKPTVNRGF